ncbi:putative ribonuclease H protein [Vitis vinifera]|uniref:Putative ribonuclease H protein n=1 Tax=Vitis vinifera TaxID=29760 RepID=A0A438FUU1_VITVI|nr:putative ribonuclease H protein [Vitis vinifera]
MGKVVSEPQKCICEGRQILYAVLIANEVVDSRLKSNQGGVLCKLDIKKAYDHVNWKFISKFEGFETRRPPLPYLFVIAMEVFSCLLRRAISGGFYLGGGGWSPFLLFGSTFGSPLKSEVVWDGVEERFRKRLAIWKRQYILKEGKLTLIQSTLSGMPIYFMSLFYLPRKVRLRLEKIQRDFLWGGGALVKRPYLVRWNLVCLEKRKGGLGVRNLALMNKTLLSKWNWCFAIEGEAFWKQVISHKYGEEEGGWCTRVISGSYGVGLWKAIRMEWFCLNNRLTFQVGCGRRVRFWKDKWCGDEPLCESFPSLFAISLDKDAWILDVWSPDDVGDGWTPIFSRAFNDWEIEMVERFMLKIQAFRVQREDKDKMVWTASKSGAFSVKSLYSMLEPGGSLLFPCGSIWKANVPPKVAFFVWEASWGKILTLEQLQRRGTRWQIGVFCLSEVEMVDHLLLHCAKTRALWSLIFSLFGVDWVLSGSVKDTILGWENP